MKTSGLFLKSIATVYDNVMNLGIALIAMAVTGCGGDIDDSSSYVTVPDVMGMTQPEAKLTITEAGLAKGEITQRYHDTVLPGLVISQSPAAGSSAAKGTMVNLWLSAYVPFGGSGVFTELVWQEEFNDTPNGLPDSNNWKFDTGFFGNADKSDYCLRGNRKENCYIENGVLHLKVTNERYYCTQKSVWRNYSSASIRTQDLHYWTQGRFETRAKLPSAPGTWPAIWMGAQLRENTGGYPGGWPAHGEIDILEASGRQQNYMSFNLHTLLYSSVNGNAYHGKYTNSSSIYDDFHIYAIEWFPDRFDWYFDNQLVYTANKHDPKRPLSMDAGVEEWRYWPFDKPFFFWLSLQYGGTGLGGGTGPGNTLTEADIALLPQVFEVDYVRVYQYPE
ncbi:MAG: family 16 glycosylhydrolase [Mangrovibacterium sp.]